MKLLVINDEWLSGLHLELSVSFRHDARVVNGKLVAEEGTVVVLQPDTGSYNLSHTYTQHSYTAGVYHFHCDVVYGKFDRVYESAKLSNMSIQDAYMNGVFDDVILTIVKDWVSKQRLAEHIAVRG